MKYTFPHDKTRFRQLLSPGWWLSPLLLGLVQLVRWWLFGIPFDLAIGLLCFLVTGLLVGTQEWFYYHRRRWWRQLIRNRRSQYHASRTL